MPSIGPMELAIAAIVAPLVLGPKRLPSAGRSLGRGIREFKDSVASATPVSTADEIDADKGLA